MESGTEQTTTYEECATPEEHRTRSRELQTNGFKKQSTHEDLSEEQIDTQLRIMIDQSIREKRVMVATRHRNQLTIWAEHELLSDPRVSIALRNGFTLNSHFPQAKEKKMRAFLAHQGRRENIDFLIIPHGEILTLWMKTVYTKVQVNIRAAILQVIETLEANPSS